MKSRVCETTCASSGPGSRGFVMKAWRRETYFPFCLISQAGVKPSAPVKTDLSALLMMSSAPAKTDTAQGSMKEKGLFLGGGGGSWSNWQ